MDEWVEEVILDLNGCEFNKYLPTLITTSSLER